VTAQVDSTGVAASVGALDRPPSADAGARPSKRRRPAVWLAGGWIGLVLLAAVFADLLPLASPNENLTPRATAPFQMWPEFLGTDRLGRSVLTRLAFGARVSFAVGLVSALVGMTIGVALGLAAGMARTADHAIGVLADSILAFPAIVALLALSAAMGPGIVPLITGLSVFAVPPFVRLARATTLQVKEQAFVKASRLLGASTTTVVLREILPSVIRPVLAYFVAVLATLIVAEASVSYLGLGVPPPTPTWGGMIAAGESQLSREPFLVFVPATVLFVTILSIGVIGRRLRAWSASDQEGG
jgi:peptide/nickel transport system permease protein